MGLSWDYLPYIIGVEFLCFFIKGIAAFGDTLIANPMLSMAMDNRVISPMNLLYQVPVNAYMAWKNRKAFAIKSALPILFAILLGVIPGVLLLKHAASWILKASLGILVISIGLEMLLRNRHTKKKPNVFAMAVSSFFSGVTTGLYGINLFFIAYVERTTDTRDAFRGNVCFIFLVENVFRITVYALSGVLSYRVLIFTLGASPGALLGFYVGSRVDRHLSEKVLRRMIIALFMASGLSILIKSLIWRS